MQVVTDLAITGKPAQFGRGVMADVSAKLLDLPAGHVNVKATTTDHLGFIGRNGAYPANQAGRYTDLVLAIGARFDDRVTGKVSAFAPDAIPAPYAVSCFS